MKKFTAEQIKRLLAEMQFQERIKKIDMGECSPLTAENGPNPFALAYQNPGQSVGCVLQTADGPIPGSVEWNAKRKVRKPSLFEQQAQRDADVRLAAAAEGSDDRDEYVGSSDGLSEPSRLTGEGSFSLSMVDNHEALDLRFSVPASTDQPIAIVHASGKVEIPDKGCDAAITNLNASVECRARKRKRASHRQATEADGTPSTESDQRSVTLKTPNLFEQQALRDADVRLDATASNDGEKYFARSDASTESDQQASEWEKRCLSESELTYFFVRHLPALERFACRWVGVRKILEDIGYEGLGKAYEELCERRQQKQFRVPINASEEQVCESIKPAIYELIRQRILDVHREEVGQGKERRFTQSLNQALSNAEQEGASLGSTIAEQSLASRSPSDPLVDKEMIEALNQAIEQLKKNQQAAIRLRYQGEYSYEEIAEAMGVARNSVASLLHRGLLELKAMLSKPKHA